MTVKELKIFGILHFRGRRTIDIPAFSPLFTLKYKYKQIQKYKTVNTNKNKHKNGNTF